MATAGQPGGRRDGSREILIASLRDLAAAMTVFG
jgi:hypothetical protein